VPKEVSAIITKREFKRKLGESEREALAAYPRYHAEVEKEIAEAKLGRVRSEVASSAKATEREAYAEALRRRADLVAAGASDRDLALTADSIAEAYPHGYDYEPEGVPPVERHTINLLRLGPDRYRAPVATLGDARKLYLKEHVRADDPTTDSRVVGFVNRVVDAAIAVIGRDPELPSITREDARKIRDEMLDRVKVTGRGVGEKVSASTVGRELSILSAVVNYGIRELGLPDSTTNPFHGLPVARVAKGRGQKPGEKRDPLPPEVLKAARQRVLAACNPALQLVWRILEGTGCRLAEVTGLTVDDVDASGPFPNIRVTWNENRRLKTETSRRHVPLVGDALEAAKEALKLAEGCTMLFPDYGRVRGSDTASAA
jgi:integrase